MTRSSTRRCGLSPFRAPSPKTSGRWSTTGERVSDTPRSGMGAPGRSGSLSSSTKCLPATSISTSILTATGESRPRIAFRAKAERGSCRWRSRWSRVKRPSSLRAAAIFRLGATGVTFSFAAAGYLEGTVRLAGQPHAARRTDGDGNGFLTDAQDRLWIDLNDDGRWDSSDEQFLYSSILSLGGGRYAARSDELGTRLAFEVIDGAGNVTLKLNRPEGSPPATELHATLIGRDGSAVGLEGGAKE